MTKRIKATKKRNIRVTNGEWLRQELIDAGPAGVTCSDIHKARMKDETVLTRGGTYASFVRYFHWFKQLGYIERTGIREPAYAKGTLTPAEMGLRLKVTTTVTVPGKPSDRLLEIRRIKKKWQETETRNSKNAEKDLEKLSGLGFQVNYAEDKLGDYTATTRGDYDSVEEYRDARTEEWDDFLNELESIDEEEEEEEEAEIEVIKVQGAALADRVYFRITPEGESAPISRWQDPLQVLHPELRQHPEKYRPRTGRPLGRPSKTIL